MLEKNGVRIAAISYDAPEILAAFARKHSVGFPLLSDKGSEAIRKFGIFNWNMAPDLRSYGVPHPVTYRLTPDGVVVKKYAVPNYLHRVTGSAVALREFGEVRADAPSLMLESGALTVQIGFPSGTAFAGQEVSWLAKFVLQPGWHIYGAPLPESYTATSLVFEGPEVLRQSFDLPPAEMLDLPLLGERLPVYSGSFQAVGSLLLKFPLPEGLLKLHGRLEFQQCSDRICEPPQSLMFSLGLTLQPFLVAESDKR